MSGEVAVDLEIPAELAGARLDQALAGLLPDYSRSLIKDWILAGQVLLAGRVPRPSERLKGGEQIVVRASAPEPGEWLPEPIPIEVLHADEHIIVVNKQAGLVVHPAVGNRTGTLVNALLHQFPDLAGLPRAGVVHRLDKDTTGVMVVARSRPAHIALVRQLAKRRVGRDYLAIVVGRVTAGGSVDAPIGRHHFQRTRMAVVDDGRPSLTHYRVLERFLGHTRLRCRLETGRTHQIRVHMDHLGYPILGDPLYGGRPRLPPRAGPEFIAALRAFRRQALHAETLTLVHPVARETLIFRAPPPADIQILLAALRAAGPEADAD
jgi:23S rRNA pseudouridine1911/1915/1917 synthase